MEILRSKLTFTLTALSLLLAASTARAFTAFALTTDNLLVVFDTARPDQTQFRAIRALPAHTVILAISIRWADQQLYGLGSDSRLYRINMESGTAATVGTAPFAVPLDGFSFGMDIDPTTDQIRIVSNTGLHMRINPASGAVIDGDAGTPGIQPDTPLRPGLVAIASATSPGSAPAPTLFGIDAAATQFVRIGGVNGSPSPNAGGVTSLDPLHQPTGPTAGLDILPHGNELFAVLTSGVSSRLFHASRIDVPWAPVGLIDTNGRPVRSLAILSVAATLWAVQDGTPQRLVRVSSTSPSAILSAVPIQGLATGEAVVTLQFGRSSGRLFAMTNSARLCTIEVGTGQATAIGAQFSPPDFAVFSAEIDAAELTMDVISSGGERLVLDLVNGTVTTGPPIETGTEIIAATNGRAAGDFGLFGLDRASRTLVLIRDDGTVTPRGPLGVAFDAAGGFDSFRADEAAYAALRDSADGLFKLYAIDLLTGAARPIDRFGDGSAVRTLAAAPPGDIGFEPPEEVLEESGALVVTMTRDGSLLPTIVDVTVLPSRLSSPTETASVPQDVAAIHTNVLFAAGQTTATVTVPIVDDALAEQGEAFEIRVDNPTMGVTIAGGFSRFVIIQKNEGNPPPVLSIDEPTSDPTFRTAEAVVALSGRAQDDDPFPDGFQPVTVTSHRGFTATVPIDAFTGVGWTQDVPLELGINVITVTAVDPQGNSNTDVITIERLSSEPPPESGIYVLAEGATGAFFDTDLALLNPNDVEVPIRIEYLTNAGLAHTDTLTLPATSHRLIQVDAIAGLEAAEVSTIVTPLVEDQRIVVERTMRWDPSHYGSHSEKATEGLSTRWLFAEGSQGFFSTYLLLANPQPTENTATVRFLVESGAPVVKTFTLAPRSRKTVGADTIAALANQSFGIEVTFEQPGVAERAMYFGQTPLFTGGHESAGTPEPSSTWFLAEGVTGAFFKTFILLANPNPVPAQVALTYFRPTGAPITTFKTVGANGRLTINVELDDPALASADVSTHVLSSVPIVVERSVYWPFTPDQWQDTHNSFGSPFSDVAWGLADLRVGGPEQFQTFVLLANPGAVEASVKVTFVRENGAPPIVRALTLAPLSRLTLTTGPGSLVPEVQDESFGVFVESDQPIVIERSMYSSPGGRIFSAGTNVVGTPIF